MAFGKLTQKNFNDRQKKSADHISMSVAVCVTSGSLGSLEHSQHILLSGSKPSADDPNLSFETVSQFCGRRPHSSHRHLRSAALTINVRSRGSCIAVTLIVTDGFGPHVHLRAESRKVAKVNFSSQCSSARFNTVLCFYLTVV